MIQDEENEIQQDLNDDDTEHGKPKKGRDKKRRKKFVKLHGNSDGSTNDQSLNDDDTP